MPFRIVWLIWPLASFLFVAGCSIHSSRSGGAAAAMRFPPEKISQPESSEELEKRAEAHAHFLAGLSFDQNRETDKALEEYEKALEGDPRNEDLSDELSRRYLQRKDYHKANAVLNKAAEAAGASGLMFARLSLIYLQQGKTNAAVEASRSAIKREPSSIAGYQGLLHLYRALGQTNEARKVIEQAAKQRKPDAPFVI